MTEKLYKNREWMYHHRVELEESTYVMAELAGCSAVTIQNWLYKLNIPTPRKLYQDYNWMYYHYWMLEESTYVMAELAKCSPMTIRNWLYILGIPTRSSGEGIFLATRNYLDMPPELQEFMEGELLGDGCITFAQGKRSASYRHGSKYEEYLIWLSNVFADWGLKQVGKINKRNTNWGIVYHYCSRSYPELVPVRQRWYPNGKKIVPRDLKLTPIMVRQWYIGDGCLHHRDHARPYIHLATCPFDKPSIDHLIEELANIGLKATYQPSGNEICISTYSVKDFLDYIGPCPQPIRDIYGYKWNYGTHKRKMGKFNKHHFSEEKQKMFEEFSLEERAKWK